MDDSNKKVEQGRVTRIVFFIVGFIVFVLGLIFFISTLCGVGSSDGWEAMGATVFAIIGAIFVIIGIITMILADLRHRSDGKYSHLTKKILIYALTFIMILLIGSLFWFLSPA